ncbi:MAG: hypothetical protein OS112_00595 [Methanoregula sp.]|nr:MAG: hypothetical protein OS112_00595 [Methanoregula sp.]
MSQVRTIASVLIALLLVGMCLCALCTQKAPGSEDSRAPAQTTVNPGDAPLVTQQANPKTGGLVPPSKPVKLIFIHHSSGENWLSDDNGGLGIALRDNNYFVSDTNYNWGLDDGYGNGPIGDYTDIGHWYTWFRGPNAAAITDKLFTESGQNSGYSRLENDPGGKNRIVMFKSCFPNSNLQGSPGDPVPAIGANPLKSEGSGSEFHTVANAKGIYNDLLEYFGAHQDTLFVVITAPPVSDPANAANARAFNNWLVNDWLRGYPYKNVAVFDFYNVLTSNGGNRDVNDAGKATGNHHRWWNGQIQHIVGTYKDTSAYAQAGDDDHPTSAGNMKATEEFVPLLNHAYNQWTMN